MIKIKDRLFEAFRIDHAILGKGLHTLAGFLRAGDEAAAKAAASRLALDAGPHIAFEEADFYPALSAFLSQHEIDEMYSDHSKGRQMLCDIITMPGGALEDETFCQRLMTDIEAAELHVSECGELFGAMGGLTEAEQQNLLNKLESWQKKSPSWLDL